MSKIKPPLGVKCKCGGCSWLGRVGELVWRCWYCGFIYEDRK